MSETNQSATAQVIEPSSSQKRRRRAKPLPIQARIDVAASPDIVDALQRVMKKSKGALTRVRAQILLAWLRGEHRDETIRHLFVSPITISKIRHRFWSYLNAHALTASDANTLVADFFEKGISPRGRPRRITLARIKRALEALGGTATDAALARRLRCHRSTLSRLRRGET